MKLVGIEFAPLCVPMHRRYEVLAGAGAFLSFAIGGFIGLFICLYLLFTPLWFLVLLYLAWMYLDRHVEPPVSGGIDPCHVRPGFLTVDHG
jgi:2-acylglycerol O-acyltransferase 2